MIAGIKGTSLIDYPGKVAAVLYTRRCSFRCPFCHNRELVLGKEHDTMTEEQALKKVSARRGFADGVVITAVSRQFIPDSGTDESIRELGFLVKLDTNGYQPEVLGSLLSSQAVDCIAMDIKTSWDKYSEAAGIEVDIARLEKSINLIKSSGIEHEFRTTCVPALVESEDIEKISGLVGGSGLYTLQQFQPENTLDSRYSSLTPYSRDKLEDFLEIARKRAASCRLIGIQ
jgi:pyruvate formate lyase activating enzyme